MANPPSPKSPSLADIRAGRRPPSKRALARQATHRRLVSCALELFVADGYIATTVDAIAARAQVSRPTFYLHFGSKLEVLEELTRELSQEGFDFYSRLDEILEAPDRDAFRAWVRDAVAWFERNTGLSPIVEEAARVEAGAMEILYEGHKAAARRLEHRARAVGVARTELEVHLLIAHIVTVTRATTGDGTWALDQGIDVLVDLWYPALTEAPAGSS
jgi:AcrR family transcriptional regulator